MQIILFQPEIPQNTGNIIRTCFLTGASLILVRPLGFSLSERQLKRAGLDYFKQFSFEEIDNLEEYLSQTKHPFYFFSSKVKTLYTSVNYSPDSILIFGSETSGLPSLYHEKYVNNFVTIPMKNSTRSLNLSNTVAIGAYEVIRQNPTLCE
jgi:tRNA (cytidine/uridine-2'-O-)-methyltransferase